MLQRFGNFKLCVLLAVVTGAIGTTACGGGNEAAPQAPPVTQERAAAATVDAHATETPATTEAALPAVEAQPAAEEPAEAEEPAPPVVAPQEEALVKVALNELLGRKILVDTNGLTLYLFDWDTDAGGESRCIDDPVYHCSQVWPPLLTIGEPRASKGVTPSLLGTQERDDGTIQVTYNGHPVNYFAGFAPTPADTTSGDIYGQAFINEWWVLSPKGEPIEVFPES